MFGDKYYLDNVLSLQHIQIRNQCVAHLWYCVSVTPQLRKEVLDASSSHVASISPLVYLGPRSLMASLGAQLVKNPPAVQKTWVRSLRLEDPLEEGMATHSSILAWRIPMDRRVWQAMVMGSQGVGQDRATTHIP